MLCLSLVPRSQKRVVSDPPELELQTGVSCHVGAGDYTWASEKWPVLSATESSPQSLFAFLKDCIR